MQEAVERAGPAATAESRGHVYDSIVETIGATPLVRLKRLAAAYRLEIDLLGKCEYFNPLSSVKDSADVRQISWGAKPGQRT